jgi:hypothetical protein
MNKNPKIKVMITVSQNVLEKSKTIAGLIPFSRYVESLLILNIERLEGEE